MVRADGETLYGKSGSLSGDELPRMLTRALEHSGRIINAKESETLVAATEGFRKFKDSDDIAKGVKALNRVSRIGVPGKIPSYARAAVNLNELVLGAKRDVLSKLDECQAGIGSGDVDSQLKGILESLKVRREYGALKILKPVIASFHKELGKNKEVAQLLKEAKVIDTALTATSKTAIVRAKTKLAALIESTGIDAIKASAKSALDRLAD